MLAGCGRITNDGSTIRSNEGRGELEKRENEKAEIGNSEIEKLGEGEYVNEKIIEGEEVVEDEERAEGRSASIGDWKTYNHSNPEFVFRYPQVWILKDKALWTEDNYRYRYEIKDGKDFLALPEVTFKILDLTGKTVDDVIEEEYLDKKYYRDNKNKIKTIERIGEFEFIKIKHLDQSGFTFYLIYWDERSLRFATMSNNTEDIYKILATLKILN